MKNKTLNYILFGGFLILILGIIFTVVVICSHYKIILF